jgi:hypothetical protein
METISNHETLPNNKVEELADVLAHAGSLLIKNTVRVVLLHGRPNRPLASHGNHLPSILQNNQETTGVCEQIEQPFEVRYVPDPNPNNEYYY